MNTCNTILILSVYISFAAKKSFNVRWYLLTMGWYLQGRSPICPSFTWHTVSSCSM